MDEDFTPIAIKPVIAGVLVATLAVPLAQSIIWALIPPPAGKVAGLSLIARFVLAIAPAMLAIPVPLILLVRRQLRDPAKRARGWGTPGIQAGVIAAALIDLGIFAALIFSGKFEGVFMPIAVVIVVTFFVLGGIIGLLARPIALYFNRNWE